MNTILRSTLAVAGLAIATPALAFVDFAWYANVGRPVASTTPVVVEIPAPRAGYIWSPGHYETRGEHQVAVAGHFVRDDFAEQVAIYNTAPYGIAALTFYDSQGKVIVISAR